MDPISPTLRVLVVDDNCDGAVSLAEVLRRLSGYETSFTTSAAQAIADALLHTPDVVISDIQMPQMDGCELADELLVMIRELTGSRPLMIAVTGTGETEDRCRAAGFNYFIRKPASLVGLLGLLRHHASQLPRAPAEGWMREGAVG